MSNESESGQRPLDTAPILATIARLQADRRYRDRQGLFFVEGTRNFVEAVDQGFAVEALFYSERLLTAPLPRKLVRRLKRGGVPFARVSPEQFRRVSRAEHASGVGAILRQQVRDLPHVAPGDRPCWVALSQVRSPGNFGTLVRTAMAVGVARFILLAWPLNLF